ncbi:MAG: hypothetical protein AAF688_11365 [Bacteroidota bacterium]
MEALYSKFGTDIENHLMLYVASAIIIATCLGGISVFYIFQNGNSFVQMSQVFLVTVFCTNVLAAILSVQKPKIIMTAFVCSLIVSTLLMIINVL